MKPGPGQRGALLALALAAALALTFGWEPPEAGDSGVAEASVPRQREAAAAAPAGPDVDLARLARGRAGDAEAGGTLFGAHSWAPPPPPPGQARVVPPPRPKAPPLPFTYVGRMVDGQRTLVFLARGDANHVVAVGDVIDETYRVESIKDGTLTLTYLPLKERQQFAIGSSE
ncbi:MAG: hypothetical protein ACOZDY_02295 [Pseudomonadota bacterium]